MTHSCPTWRSSDLAAQPPADWAKFDNGGKGYLNPLEFGNWLMAKQGTDMTAEVERTKTSKRADLPAIKVLNATSSQFLKRSEEHTSELPSLMRNSYAVFCLKNKNHYHIP